MKLSRPLEIYVYYVTQESLEFSKLGIEHEEEVELRDICIYNVDHIVKYLPLINSKPATRLQTGGTDYLVNMDYESLKSLINEHI